MKPKMIPWKYIPVGTPWQGTAVCYLLLKSADAPGWIWGAVGALMLFVWVAWGFCQFGRAYGEPWLEKRQ